MTKYSDLQNDGLPVEERLKHLEREAGFVREYAITNTALVYVTFALSVVALALSVISLLK